MRKIWSVIVISICLICACGEQKEMHSQEEEAKVYMQITAEQAKEIMDTQEDILIVDVREQSEYDEGHIPGAVLLPVGTITEETATALITDKEKVVLIYCRSGNRSKTAAQALADLGYTQVYEFGGIRDWPYDVEK